MAAGANIPWYTGRAPFEAARIASGRELAAYGQLAGGIRGLYGSWVKGKQEAEANQALLARKQAMARLMKRNLADISRATSQAESFKAPEITSTVSIGDSIDQPTLAATTETGTQSPGTGAGGTPPELVDERVERGGWSGDVLSRLMPEGLRLLSGGKSPLIEANKLQGQLDAMSAIRQARQKAEENKARMLTAEAAILAAKRSSNVGKTPAAVAALATEMANGPGGTGNPSDYVAKATIELKRRGAEAIASGMSSESTSYYLDPETMEVFTPAQANEMEYTDYDRRLRLVKKNRRESVRIPGAQSLGGVGVPGPTPPRPVEIIDPRSGQPIPME